MKRSASPSRRFDIKNLDHGYKQLPIAEWANLGKVPSASCSLSTTRLVTKSGSRSGAVQRKSLPSWWDDKTLKLKAVIMDKALVTPDRQVQRAQHAARRLLIATAIQ